MKILYAIQGTGNGHINRARTLVPTLKSMFDTDVLISGLHHELDVPFNFNYRCHGIGYTFGRNGGIDYFKTFRQLSFIRSLQEINQLPVKKYDLIISDFEPISSWAAKLRNIPCYSLSHQAAVIQPDSPKPSRNDFIGRTILQQYAPSNESFGFHFKSYNSKIFTPIINKEIRNQEIKNVGHYTVYLPAFSDEKIIALLSGIKDIYWHVFSKNTKIQYKTKNVFVRPIDYRKFVVSMSTAAGILCGAGFETPAEALFMNKKLLVIPMKYQYEQHCNAAALQQLGIPSIMDFGIHSKKQISSWLADDKTIQIEYPDHADQVLQNVINFFNSQSMDEALIDNQIFFDFLSDTE